jgi:DNA primase
MEIADIKAQLSLAQVLDHYGLKPDKHGKLNHYRLEVDRL